MSGGRHAPGLTGSSRAFVVVGAGDRVADLRREDEPVEVDGVAHEPWRQGERRGDEQHEHGTPARPHRRREHRRDDEPIRTRERGDAGEHPGGDRPPQRLGAPPRHERERDRAEDEGHEQRL